MPSPTTDPMKLKTLMPLALLLAVLFAHAAASEAPVPTPPELEIVLVVGPDSEVEQGSLGALLAQVRAGAEVRVGWELDFGQPGGDEPRLLEHWADGAFLSIWQGHLFAQLRGINVQGPVLDEPRMMLESESLRWTAIASTTGTFRQVFGEETSDMRARTRWAVAR